MGAKINLSIIRCEGLGHKMAVRKKKEINNLHDKEITELLQAV
jgi:hypothetical protein